MHEEPGSACQAISYLQPEKSAGNLLGKRFVYVGQNAVQLYNVECRNHKCLTCLNCASLARPFMHPRAHLSDMAGLLGARC